MLIQALVNLHMLVKEGQAVAVVVVVVVVVEQ
jgi:hypothetical protein